ncbi:MAG: bifunctional pyr operon transcriptional regulator/uracil phosphoribosyltransferase [Flavobacteriales bacterium]|nr:bifunctional pyr operon transcriptional regulator/uracil phosphoribosyltransferase [Flavobacteriales bacterium]|tara:strand:- start:4305 stop:4853 length:549 start_codon:yes stop_codon:yes gene_type:complete
MKSKRLILNQTQLALTIKRLCFQLIENHNDFSDTVLIGLQPRGIYLAKRIQKELNQILGSEKVLLGSLDTTFFRDDFRRRDSPLIPNKTRIDFIIEDKKVVLIDDVLYTGRTIRSGLDAMLAYGRPKLVELLVLVDRRFSRHLPIEPNYVGETVDSVDSERIEAQWEEVDGKNQVILKEIKQ